MTLYYFQGTINPGVTTAQSLTELNEVMNDDTRVTPDASLAIIPGETISDAIRTFSGLFPNVNSWKVDQIPTFQNAILEAKYGSFLGRPLTDKEVAEACAVSAGQTWDSDAYDQAAADKQNAAAMLKSLMSDGDLPEGFNPDDPDSLDDTDEDSVGDRGSN